jgi:hypothetical protein
LKALPAEIKNSFDRFKRDLGNSPLMGGTENASIIWR